MANRPQFDRRAIFFWATSLWSLLFVFITPDDFKWVGITLGVWLAVLGLASWADDVSRRRGRT